MSKTIEFETPDSPKPPSAMANLCPNSKGGKAGADLRADRGGDSAAAEPG